MMRRRLVAAAALVAVAFGAVLGLTGSASAAKLAVSTAPQITLSTLQQCAASMNGTTPVINTASAGASTVTVSSLPAACAGLPMSINLHNSSGAIIAHGTTASAATSQTVNVGTYNATAVTYAIATIDGWVFPTAWKSAIVTNGCVGLDASGNPTSYACTLTLGTVTTWKAGDYWYSQFQFSAQTTAPLWKVIFNFADTTKFQGFTPTVVLDSQNVALAPGYSCSQLPVFMGVEENPGWGSPNGDLTITNNPAEKTNPASLCK